MSPPNLIIQLYPRVSSYRGEFNVTKSSIQGSQENDVTTCFVTRVLTAHYMLDYTNVVIAMRHKSTLKTKSEIAEMSDANPTEIANR